MNHWATDKSDVPAAVHARLLQVAKSQRTAFDTVAVRYVTERLLYRLSRSEYADRFVLKGAWLFYVWEIQRRTTRDVDFLGRGENSVEHIKEAFRQVSQLDVTPDDGLKFDHTSIDAWEVQESEEYAGVRLRMTAFLGNGQYRAQVDVGFGDALIENPVEAELPVLLEYPRPRIRAYRAEALIAEKLEAMVRFAGRNSRMKDYFDLFILSRERQLDGAKLQKQISATFSRRDTQLPAAVPTGLREEFGRHRQEDWAHFLENAEATGAPHDFPELIAAIRNFALPPLLAASDERPFSKNWSPEAGWH